MDQPLYGRRTDDVDYDLIPRPDDPEVIVHLKYLRRDVNELKPLVKDHETFINRTRGAMKVFILGVPLVGASIGVFGKKLLGFD